MAGEATPVEMLIGVLVSPAAAERAIAGGVAKPAANPSPKGLPCVEILICREICGDGVLITRKLW